MFSHYIATALRNFRRHWVTSLVNVFGLGLGLACFIGVLSAVHYFRLDDSHQPGADRVYFVTQRYTQGNAKELPLEFPNAPFALGEQLRADLPQLELVARRTGYSLKSFTLDGAPHDLDGSYVDAEFLEMFALPFKDGNPSHALSRANRAVLSEQAARKLFGDGSAVGRTILLDGQQPVVIDGVVAFPERPSHIVRRDADVGISFDVLLSIGTLEAAVVRDGGEAAVATQLRAWSGGLTAGIYVRLPKDGSIGADYLKHRLAELAAEQPRAGRGLSIRPMSEYRQMGLDRLTDSRTTGLSWSELIILIGSMMLLITAINCATLSTALVTAHRKEEGVRRVLGASFTQLAAQRLIEGALVVFAAGTIAFMLLTLSNPIAKSVGLVDLFYAVRHSISIWPSVLASLAFCIVLVSVAPIVITTRQQLAASLQHSRGGAAKLSGIRWLVGTQFFLAGALLTFALVVHMQQREILQHAHDSVPYPIVAVSNDLKRSGVDIETLRTELLRQPHIQSVSNIGFTPWGRSYSLAALSASNDAAATDVNMMVHSVDHRYFDDMGFGLLAGRVFDPNRTSAMAGSPSPASIILDRTAARQLGYDHPEAAVGQLIYPHAAIRNARPDVALRVIGVVDDKMMQFTTSGVSGNAYTYSANARVPLIRLKDGHLTEGMAEVRAVWRSLAPNFALRASPIDEVIQRFADDKAVYVRALNGVTALALIVSLSGLIGMSIHMANRRRHEIGVRKTLGARTSQLVAMLLRDFSRPVMIGAIAAWPLAYVVSQIYLNVYAHRIELSPTPFVGSLIIALAIACAAVGWHTARAARVRPADVLRHE